MSCCMPGKGSPDNYMCSIHFKLPPLSEPRTFTGHIECSAARYLFPLRAPVLLFITPRAPAVLDQSRYTAPLTQTNGGADSGVRTDRRALLGLLTPRPVINLGARGLYQGNQRPPLGNQGPSLGNQKPPLGNRKPPSGNQRPPLDSQRRRRVSSVVEHSG